jgi:serine/threonine protein kinase
MFHSPELFSKKEVRGRPADIWTAGLTLYMIAVGFGPYDEAKGMLDLRNMILTKEIDYSIIPDTIFTDFLKKMLDPDPKKRYEILQLTEDDWLSSYMTKQINIFACEETIKEESSEYNVSKNSTSKLCRTTWLS